MDAMNNTSNNSTLANNAPSKPAVTVSAAQWYQPKPPGMWYGNFFFNTILY
ncbi:hypothetical protein SOMG_00058 [Schizosaccharomyces osmophilus]|uniref:Uncharacterized protein n=1 Tax=Schizosaccharomyces osmophilus TaxID=2545709 RepID=A0AAE9W9T2_9SCHI|nr:uncharacterized protein SOMG_00039 [Schizosaccharomyces osmophilus]XP_056037004.1 uncharacterized protein SOMG_00058 [Schizosaccharomyces osmophilus]WBW72382.1 hypothetical protein SOMG_00039 [Schizosaccharomyces osmophilus]WBW72761.1 hypothetical protein SOMG_00058 [Schizosaccharomyces osmophilus]